ncbi:hypothetical protein NDU88_000411 [Pleurodeles waltl]|uniref:Uncharacterized protein n=1 Tax=Pleurodeles waltl TaxID=8319 RepID=A0AAV7S7F2_PLEWA|nr:hypothetical protein NDU88_000411 [Pleurodeles waltl]
MYARRVTFGGVRQLRPEQAHELGGLECRRAGRSSEPEKINIYQMFSRAPEDPLPRVEHTQEVGMTISCPAACLSFEVSGTDSVSSCRPQLPA